VARLLVQLKLRILLNALRASTRAKVSFIISTFFAIVLAIGTFAILALLRGNAAAVDETTVIFTLFAFGWLILPILVFGLDGTLDPAALALFPLRTRPLALGLLAASVTGAWPLANVIGLMGVTVGLAHGAAGVIVAVLAVLLQVLFCITLARFFITTLARVLRSRRGRDLAAFLVLPIFALYEFFIQVVPRAAAQHRLGAGSFTGIDHWIRWIPPGLAAHAIQDASSGRLGVALLRLLFLAAVTAVLGWLWIRALNRALVTADSSSQTSAVRAASLPFPRYGLTGTVAARFLIYQRREPTSLIYWGIIAVVMVVVSFRTVTTSAFLGGVLFAIGLGAAMTGVFHANSVGVTGPGFGSEAVALTDRRELRSYFCGQNIALAIVGIPLLTLFSFVLMAIAGHPVDGFLALAVGLAALGAALGLSNIFSAVVPYPMERRIGSPVRRAAEGYVGQSLAGTFGTLLGVGVCVVPVVIAVGLTGSMSAVLRVPVLFVAAAVYGVVLAWAGQSIAAGAAESRMPELYQVAIRSTL
jgi:ABC-2 type transport system permease protein